MRIVPYGAQALLLELADTAQAVSVYEQLRRRSIDGVVDVVPAARTVLVTFDGADALARGSSTLAAVVPLPPGVERSDVVDILVTYDGPDLDAVAQRSGLGVDEVIATHAAGDYVVAFLGFAPGFGYLTGLDDRLQLPRRDEPRTRVEPGSVAIAGEYTAVYPGASPGGWHLIGRTTAPLWDLDRSAPSLLQPGGRVRFVPLT